MHRGRPSWLQAFRNSKHPLTWLSLAVMGSGCFRFRQFGKGLLYLLSELAFFRFFFGFGWKYLSHFGTLGENTQLKVWNEELQIYQRVPGDNSMLILLFSVLTIAAAILFVYLWVLNVKSAGELCLLDAQGKHIPSFREDLKSLLDSRFHTTLLAAPMISLAAFTVLPIVFMVLIAFTNFDSAHQPPGELFTWTGMTNVTDIFLGNQTKTHTFFGIFGWTIIWAILATFTNYILGMLLAILINHKLVKMKKVWRTLFVISIAIPQFVSLLLISRALEPMGAVNIALMKLGWISAPLPFLTDKTLARICVVIINMWIGIPYTMLTFSGVLMNIPADLYESAELDGAGPFRRFTSITLGMFPGFMSMIAIYHFLKAIGLDQTLLALILVYSGGAALNYYIAKGFFDTIPKALDEAATLDGATKHIIFWKIILPNSKPIVANTAINAFIAPWVDFIFVSVIMKDNYNNYTVAKGLYTMVDKANIFEYYTAFCAGAVLISIPIVILFIRLQEFYVGGVTAGASKG